MGGHLQTDTLVSGRNEQRWPEQPVDILPGHRKMMMGSLAEMHNEMPCQGHRVPPPPMWAVRIPRRPEVHDRVHQQISTLVQARRPLTHGRPRTTEDVMRDRGCRACKRESLPFPNCQCHHQQLLSWRKATAGQVKPGPGPILGERDQDYATTG